MSFNPFVLWGCCILLMTSFGCSATAMGSVALRADGSPGPEICPEEARKAMNYLEMFVGTASIIQLDANQRHASPVTLYEGNIESILEGELGLLGSQTRLYGRVWTGGPKIVIRYYAAQSPRGGNQFPICAVARKSLGQFRKSPESKPGTAIIEFSSAAVFIVNEFR